MDLRRDNDIKRLEPECDPEFYRSVLQLSSLMFNVLDSNFHVVMCNENTYRSFGFEKEEEYLENFENLSPPVQSDGVSTEVKFLECAIQAYKTGKNEFEWMHCDLRGRAMPFKVTLIRIDATDSYGGNYMIAFLEDMRQATEEQKQAEQFKQKMKAVIDATPLCLNLWNEKFENVMCNKKASELFGLSGEEEYLERFFELSPMYQPNNKLSKEWAMEKIQEAFDTGGCQFSWLHCNLEGDQIPSEIILSRIDGVEDGDQKLVAGFTRDLRQQLAGHNNMESYGDYFLNYISDKMLFKAVVELTDELFFGLDIRTSLIQYYGKRRVAFGFGSEHYDFPEEIIAADLIHPDDIPIFRKLSENMKNGVYEPLDMRFIFKDGTCRYYQVEYHTLYNQNNEPIFSIGKAIDINEKKELEIRSSVDSLTGCLNKATTKTRIEDVLQRERDGSHALFIVDIDDFKAVNDTFGHHFGDLVLGEIAKHLKKCFRKRDIIGRIGGDEFIVFVNHVEDENVLVRQANKMIEGFHTIFSNENQTCKIAASIGIARYPEDGKNYDELYKAADKALYRSKGRGKDGYTLYRKDYSAEGGSNITILENTSRLANAYYDTSMVSAIFRLLYETTDIRATIHTILQLLGNQMQLERCYILEMGDDGETYNNIYEWCADQIASGIKKQAGVSEDSLKPLFQMASRDGIVYSDDVSAIEDPYVRQIMEDKGVKAFLHVQIRERNCTKLFLGADVCLQKRTWGENEINNMLYVARMVAAFLR